MSGLSRKHYNWQIMYNLMDYIDENPDVRFGQALINLDIPITTGKFDSLSKIDYYMESCETLDRVNTRIKELVKK